MRKVRGGLCFIFIFLCGVFANEIGIEAPTESAARRLAAAMGYEYVQVIYPGMHLLRGSGTDGDHTAMRAAAPVHVIEGVERHHRRGPPVGGDRSARNGTVTPPPLGDPMYARQWHLHGRRGLPTAVHMNVEAAWADGASGHGVVIAVPDDGVESRHRDLVNNLLPGLAPRNLSPEPSGAAFHGTACASTAAGSRGDGTCGVGVA